MSPYVRTVQSASGATAVQIVYLSRRTEVRLRTDDGRFLVIMAPDGAVVAEHFLVPPGGASVRDEHCLPAITSRLPQRQMLTLYTVYQVSR